MTSLSVIVLPQTTQGSIAAKTPSDYPSEGISIEEFEIWREGYAGATVNIYRGGTTELIPVYTDIFLTQEAPNPQILLSRTDNDGTSFGKFQSPLYSPYPYQVEIDGEETLGIKLLPITDLAGKDGSNIVVKSTGSTELRTLKERFSETIHAKDYGLLGDSAAENTATLTAAIAAAASQGGGRVIVPAGTYNFNQLTLPAKVILAGQGKEVTILESLTAAKVIEVTGNGAGLADIQLDGVLLNSGSIGLYGKARNTFTMQNVIVRRFDTGIHWQGGENHTYNDLTVRNCNKNVRMLGDSDFSGTGGGARWTGCDWRGGEVSQSVQVGLELSVNDLECIHNAFEQIDFVDNIGDDGAVLMYGARYTKISNCYWSGNDYEIKIQDNPDATLEFNSVVGLQVYGGEVADGTIVFDGLCQDVVFDQVDFDGTTFELNVPINNITLRDCSENLTLFTGDTLKITRFETIADGTVKGVTTNATATTAYKIKLNPNEVVSVLVVATAERTNGAGKAGWVKAHTWTAGAATLNYDSQTVNFTAGRQIQGQTSGATAVIVSDSDSGSTGTLSLGPVTGTFVDDEIITEVSGTGSARTNGTLVKAAVSTLGATTAIHDVGTNTNEPPAGWDVTFTQSGQEGWVQVTGASSNDINWAVRVQVTRL